MLDITDMHIMSFSDGLSARATRRAKLEDKRVVSDLLSPAASTSVEVAE